MHRKRRTGCVQRTCLDRGQRPNWPGCHNDQRLTPLPPANIAEMLELSTSVQYVKGIGPRLAEVLGAKGIHTVDDLLHYLPFRYEDRLNPRGISELRAGEMATVIAEVRTSGLFRTRRMPIFQMTAGQGRSRLKCIWFNATYLRDRFQARTTGGPLRQGGRRARR